MKTTRKPIRIGNSDYLLISMEDKKYLDLPEDASELELGIQMDENKKGLKFISFWNPKQDAKKVGK